MAEQEHENGDNGPTSDEIIGIAISLGISFVLLIVIIGWIHQKAASAGIQGQPLPWMW